MTERGVFIALVATVLHRLSRFVPAYTGIARIYLAYAIGFISTLNMICRFFWGGQVECISVFVVTAAYGSALPAAHF